jgi:signal peptidase I
MLPRPEISSGSFMRELVETLLLIVLIYALVEMAIPRYMVEGRSMQPNFLEGQRLIVSRINFLVEPPARGDIVVFNAPGNDDDAPPLIKRVIGLPGETIAIRDSKVMIDGVELGEPYISQLSDGTRCNDPTYCTVILQSDQYYVMGDNRGNSRDSRRFGPIVQHDLIGEVLVRYWPPSAWGIVTQIGFPAD